MGPKNLSRHTSNLYKRRRKHRRAVVAVVVAMAVAAVVVAVVAVVAVVTAAARAGAYTLIYLQITPHALIYHIALYTSKY